MRAVLDSEHGGAGGEAIPTGTSTSGTTVGELRHALSATRRRLALLFEATPAGLAVNVADSGVFEIVNQSLCDLLGYRKEEMIGRSAASFMHPEDALQADAHGAAAAAAPGSPVRTRIRFRHRSGRTVVVDLTLTRIDDGDTPLMFVQMVDVSRYLAESEELRVRSETDALTGLANRVHLTRVLTEMSAARAPCAVLYIDLDGFKPVNDTRGHAAGDEVLARVAIPLLAAAGPSDLVARVGGDEFVIVCRASGAANPRPWWPRRTALHVAARIEDALLAPLAISSGPVQLTASIGISDGTIGAPSPLDMLEQADAAMYAAKQRGKNRYVRYDAYMRAVAVTQRTARDLVSTAAAEGRARLQFQPVIERASLQPVGYTVSLLVNDYDGRALPWQDVLEALRRSGLAHPLAKWSFLQAARAVAECRTAHDGPDRFLSVAVAGRRTPRSDLHMQVTRLLAVSGLPAGCLLLSLPESALSEPDDGLVHQLGRLRTDGVRLAIGNFGSGPTSLALLERLPVTDVRLSRRLLSGEAASGAGPAATLRAVVAFADAAGLTCTATGVDDARDFDRADAVGIRLMQGRFFAPPREAPMTDLPAPSIGGA